VEDYCKVVKNVSMFKLIHSILRPSIYSRRTILVVTSILISALLIDATLVKIYDFIVSISINEILFTAFIIITCIYVISQYTILKFTENRIKKSKTEWTMPEVIHKTVRISQYVLSGVLVITVLEILFRSHYDTFILETVIIVSYGLSVITLGLLAQRFFSWFRSRRSIVILLYTFSSIVFVLNILFSIMFVLNIMDKISNLIESHGHNLLYFNNPGSFEYYLYNVCVISSIISFILSWIATAIILHPYSKRIGSIKYWILVSFPLVYFLSQFISLTLNLFSPLLDQNPVFFGVLLSVIFPISKAVGGMLFGVGFWAISRTINELNIVRDYLVITAIGFILLFVSDQAVSLIIAPYPPFGLTSVATVGLASYLILVGLYYSAISVSNDIELRKFISSSAIKEFNLLRTIGSAQTEEQIQKIVTKIVSDQSKNIEVLPVTSSEEDMRDYAAFVLNEIRQQKEKHDMNTNTDK
jgi:hypothetical protein